MARGDDSVVVLGETIEDSTGVPRKGQERILFTIAWRRLQAARDVARRRQGAGVGRELATTVEGKGGVAGELFPSLLILGSSPRIVSRPPRELLLRVFLFLRVLLCTSFPFNRVLLPRRGRNVSATRDSAPRPRHGASNDVEARFRARRTSQRPCAVDVAGERMTVAIGCCRVRVSRIIDGSCLEATYYCVDGGARVTERIRTSRTWTWTCDAEDVQEGEDKDAKRKVEVGASRTSRSERKHKTRRLWVNDAGEDDTSGTRRAAARGRTGSAVRFCEGDESARGHGEQSTRRRRRVTDEVYSRAVLASRKNMDWDVTPTFSSHTVLTEDDPIRELPRGSTHSSHRAGDERGAFHASPAQILHPWDATMLSSSRERPRFQTRLIRSTIWVRSQHVKHGRVPDSQRSLAGRGLKEKDGKSAERLTISHSAVFIFVCTHPNPNFSTDTTNWTGIVMFGKQIVGTATATATQRCLAIRREAKFDPRSSGSMF
ncbi:hypothetical protein B0H12DRAFT_1067285 [Mycena haematopus]|nr:hypothetical protein B0H12DRAFT_1067285 [Mycena haematopus]